VDDDARFEQRAQELGLARTLGLPVDATITARTLAASYEQGEPLPSTLPDLPRISVDGRESISPPSPARRDYTIMGTLGEGGMGRVQLARQRSLDRDVALKTLKPDAGSAVAQALLREARITGALEHPGVIPIHALGVDEQGRPMLVMKRIDGVDLSVLLRDPQHAAWRGRSDNRLVAALEILMQVCLTVEFAHSRGVIHRDIKPENIMVGGFGEVYLLDWGIATTDTKDQALVGTPAYMAPEMALGEPVTAATDAYLVGATLHEIVTGKSRHDGATVVDALRQAAKSAPVSYDHSVSDELADLCNRATSRDPAQRPTVAAVRAALADFLRHRTARSLCDAAVERLDALAKLQPFDLAQAYRLITEARFGLVQSLREHPADGNAQRSMQRCLAAAIDLELRQGHADTAEALLHEMQAPDPALKQRIDDTRADLDRRARERERLEALDRDHDPSEKSPERSRQLLWGSAVLAGLSLILLVRGGNPTPPVALLAAALGLVFVLGSLVVLRRRLLTNAFNRRAAGALIAAMVALVARRVLNLLHPMPFDELIASDLLVLAVCAAVGSITLLSRLYLVAVPLVGGMIAVEIWPANSAVWFAASAAIAMLLAAWVLARARRST
jgi:serine/threonine-protein kinase